MECHKIKIENFRNIRTADVAFSSHVNLLLGNNAQGKTNLLEAISLLALGKSFRGAKDAEMISFGQNASRVTLTYSDAIRQQTLSAGLSSIGRKKIEQNGVSIGRMSDIVGAFRIVLFTPEHLTLIKSGPETRRNFLDIALSQLRPMYLSSLQRYGKILKERNRLIKNASDDTRARKIMMDTVDLWSAQLAHEAAIIARYRAEYIRKIHQMASLVFRDMTDDREKPSYRYVGSSGQNEEAYFDVKETEKTYLRLLSSSLDREIGAGFTLWGIHRDDIAIDLNGVPARLYASQGQQRSMALAMKLAEGDISHECFGDYPVFLFDDVLSELDAGRRDYLTERICNRQVILTSCEPTQTGRLGDAKVIFVKDGTFEEK